MDCQGSHVASQAGSYVLQWKYFDAGRGSFDLRSAAHKSKIMYYTEVLQSDKFKFELFSCHHFFAHILKIHDSLRNHCRCC